MALTAAGFAQTKAPSVTVKSFVNNSTITIGDKITYTLSVLHRPDIKVTMPAPGANLGDFEIKDFQVFEPRSTKDKLVEVKQVFILTTFTVGDYVIPAQKILYQDENGEKKEISSEQIFIKVASVGKSESDSEDIRPNKEQIADKTPNWVYYLAGFLISLLLVGILLLFYFKKLRKQEEPASLIPEPPPYEWARQRLTWIREQDLLEKGRVKEHYDLLSDCVRGYLERLYQLPLMDRTTLEIFSVLKDVRPLRPHLVRINDFLKESDLVKFARFIPDHKANEDSWQTAENIIESLRPRETSEIEGESQ